MFERNRVDDAPEVSAVPVEITLLDGTLIKGKLLVPVLKSLFDCLNGGVAFVEFEPYGGDKCYIAKAQLAAVEALGVPRVPALQARLRETGEFDPYAVSALRAGLPEMRSGRPMWRWPRPIIPIATPMWCCRQKWPTTWPPWHAVSTPRTPPSRHQKTAGRCQEPIFTSPGR